MNNIKTAHLKSGTNLQAIIDALDTSKLPQTEISLVLSNRKAAFGLTRAETAKPPIKTAYLALQPYLRANPGRTRDDYDSEVAKIVLEEHPDAVVLAGWMHVLGDAFLEKMYRENLLEDAPTKPIPVINLHPALPGQFDGANAIERAFDAFQKGEITHSGVMVHRVIREVDRGEPLVVRKVVLTPEDTLETFAQKLHKEEWEIIVEAANMVLEEAKPLTKVSFIIPMMSCGSRYSCLQKT